LFTSKGHVIVGKPGCSRFFILGMLDVVNPEELGGKLNELRADLLSDPYFKDVPSMHPKAKKTARAFHAKDDLPEVRREVLALLRDTDGLRVFAVVTDKRRVLEYVRGRNAREPDYRYHSNELYDYLARRLFRDRLHKDSGYNIHFARRGKSDRTAALSAALTAARNHFQARWGIISEGPIQIFASKPVEVSALQAADYFLWALQRLYERGEDRYVAYLWPAFKLVHDIDDTRVAGYGVYYSQKKPLTTTALECRYK
jgi:hypothetical protein